MSKKPLIDGLPADFVERIHLQYPHQAQEILSTFQQKPPAIRVNTLLSSIKEVKKNLEQNGIHAEIPDYLPNTFLADSASRREITDLKIYQEGHLYIQSIASQLVVKALDPQPGEKILDLCSAPGSKTTQIAIAMNKKGELIANDNNRTRLYRLKANLEHQRVDDFVTVKNYSGQNYPKFYPEYFDRVLVDAPCSSESRFDPRYPKSIHFWSRHKVKAMAKVQRRLLSAAIECVKPGGVVVYSTCTLAPEENEGVLNATLKKHPEVKVQKLDWQIKTLPTLQEWNGKLLQPDIAKAIRLYPNVSIEPFFIALLHKQE